VRVVGVAVPGQANDAAGEQEDTSIEAGRAAPIYTFEAAVKAGSLPYLRPAAASIPVPLGPRVHRVHVAITLVCVAICHVISLNVLPLSAHESHPPLNVLGCCPRSLAKRCRCRLRTRTASAVIADRDSVEMSCRRPSDCEFAICPLIAEGAKAAALGRMLACRRCVFPGTRLSICCRSVPRCCSVVTLTPTSDTTDWRGRALGNQTRPGKTGKARVTVHQGTIAVRPFCAHLDSRMAAGASETPGHGMRVDLSASLAHRLSVEFDGGTGTPISRAQTAEGGVGLIQQVYPAERGRGTAGPLSSAAARSASNMAFCSARSRKQRTRSTVPELHFPGLPTGPLL